MNDKTKRFIKMLLVLDLGIAIGIGIGLWMPVTAEKRRNEVLHFDVNKETSFHDIRLNMNRKDVVALMGSEGTQGDHFELPQRGGYEFEYAAAAKSGAKYFISWPNGGDYAYVVGFDEHDKTVFKAKGKS